MYYFFTWILPVNGRFCPYLPTMYCSLLNGNRSQALRVSFVMGPLPLVWKCLHQVIHIWENQSTFVE